VYMRFRITMKSRRRISLLISPEILDVHRCLDIPVVEAEPISKRLFHRLGDPDQPSHFSHQQMLPALAVSVP
jgi:hypothetical protein